MSTKLMKLKSLLLMTGISLMSGACTTLRVVTGIGYENPEISFEDITFKKFNSKTIEAEIKLAVTNPNDFELQLQDLKYSASDQEGRVLAEGLYPGHLVLKKNSSDTLRFDLSMSPSSLVNNVAELLLQPNKARVLVFGSSAKVDTFFGYIPISSRKEKKFCLADCS